MESGGGVLSLRLSPEAQIEVAAFSQRLLALSEESGERLLNKFLSLLDGALLKVDIPSSVSTPSAGDHVIGLRVTGYCELVTSAAVADECKA